MDRTNLDSQARAYLEEEDRKEGPPLSSFSPRDAKLIRNDINKDIMEALGPRPPGVSTRDLRIPGFQDEITLRIYKPETEGTLPVFLYIHGGGWVICDLDTHDRVCANICRMAQCLVVSVDYHLAPEDPFPIPLEDCYSALKWVADNTGKLSAKPGSIAIGGDSAGGNLAAALCLLARDRGVNTIGYQVLIYPALNLADLHAESYRLFAEGFGLTIDDSKWFLDCYLPAGTDRRDPLASPLFEKDLKGLPPAFILTAGHDILRDDGILYAKKLCEAGVAVIERPYEDQIHGFLTMDGVISAAGDAFREIAEKLTDFFQD
jgi:acetyl esterase